MSKAMSLYQTRRLIRREIAAQGRRSEGEFARQRCQAVADATSSMIVGLRANTRDLLVNNELADWRPGNGAADDAELREREA
jgi:hypothetical protein